MTAGEARFSQGKAADQIDKGDRIFRYRLRLAGLAIAYLASSLLCALLLQPILEQTSHAFRDGFVLVILDNIEILVLVAKLVSLQLVGLTHSYESRQKKTLICKLDL